MREARRFQISRRQNSSGLELEIDQLVYQFYGLTPDEIALIESSVGAGKENSLKTIPMENEEPL